MTWRFNEIKQLPDIVRYWATKKPGKIALIEANRTRTYAALDAISNKIANGLMVADISPRSHIGFVGRNCVELFEIWFAAGKAGCALTPLNWRSSAEELRQLIEDAMPPVVFVSAEFLKVMQDVQNRSKHAFKIIGFDPAEHGGGKLALWADEFADSDPCVPLTGTDIALLSYTSGTTGQPKGVQSSHDAFNYSFLCGSLEPAMAWDDDDIMLMSMPNFHLAGSWVSIAALYHGATLSILPSFEVTSFVDTLRRDRPSVIPMVPAAIQMLLNTPGVSEDDFRSVRSIMYFGSPIGRGALQRALRMFACTFNQFYGATEVWFVAILPHAEHLGENPARLAACGRKLPLVNMKVIDIQGNEVKDGVVGELMIRTPMAFSGYWNRPQATAEVLQDGWYRSGDMGFCDAEGFYYLVDRAKDMIITGGENVYSIEVEQVLQKHASVAMVAVIGAPDERWGEKVTAFVVLREGSTATEEELRQHCRAHLAGFKVPKTVIFEAALPVTPVGKIQKQVLRARVERDA